MSTVIALAEARSLVADRAHALLGANPTLTFTPDERDDGGVCIRLRPAGRDTWVGLVADRSPFTERLRMGARARFLAHHAGTTPTVCGAAAMRIVGRVRADGGVDGELASTLRQAAGGLAAEAFVPSCGLLVVEVHLEDMRVDEGDGPAHGAIPRT